MKGVYPKIETVELSKILKERKPKVEVGKGRQDIERGISKN